MGYYIANQGVQRGPIELHDLPRQGLRADSMVWTEGMSDWQPAAAVPEVARLLPQILPAPIAHPPTIAYQTPTPGQSNGMAVASLVLGIIAVPFSCHPLLGILPGILAIVFGFSARANIRRGQTTAGGGMAMAGIICGFVPIALLATLIFIGLAFVFGAVMHHALHP
jgi:hypothetical protein